MSKLEELIQRYCPDGVEWSTIGDVCQKVFAGGTPTSSNSSYYGGDIPWLRSGEVNFNEITSTEKTITEEGYNSSSARWVESRSVLVAMTGATVARSAITLIELTANQSVCALIPKRDILNYRYLFYWISKSYIQMKGMAQGALTSLNLNLIKSLEIPIPPLPVQEEIVRVLDTFTELQAELQAELQKRLQQYNYYRDNLLSFEGRTDVKWKKLGDVADLLSGFPFDSTQFTNTGIRLMRGMNIKRGQLCFNEKDDRYWKSEEGLEKYIVQENDIVISMDGSLVGRSFGMVKKEDLPLLLVQRVARVRSSVFNINYIYHCINNWFPDYVDKKKTKGAIPHISMKDISNFPIPSPSLEEQEKIVSILDRFEALTNDLSAGLPAEIEKRRQQYEFYRDKLLTFKRKEA